MGQKRGLILLLTVLLMISTIINLTVNLTAISTLTGRVVSQVTGQISLCLNSPPSITAISSPQRGHFNNNFTLQVQANDSAGQILTYYDNVTLFAINSSTGLINFTPFRTEVGQYHILITVADDGTSCPKNETASFILNINNSVPTLSSTVPNQTWEEDVTLTGLDLDDYFSDADNDSLNYSVSYGSYVTVTINNVAGVNKGKVTFKPDKDFNGISWAIFTANDSVDTVNSNNVTLNITPVANSCGDTICNSGESCSSCTADCGQCPASSSGGGGGGGGGGGSAGAVIPFPKVILSEEQCNAGQVLADQEKEFSFNNFLPVKWIKLVINKDKEKTCMNQYLLEEKPASIPKSPPAIIYHYLMLESKQIKNHDMQKGTLSFKIDSSWLDGNGFHNGEIALYYYGNPEWMELPTTFQSMENGQANYLATFPEFSYFAIGGKKKNGCETKEVCGSWLPEACSEGDVQQQSCIKVNSDCTTEEFFQERSCLCLPSWQCTLWQPLLCTKGYQERSCLDVNNCGRERDLPLERSCTRLSEAIAGKAFYGGFFKGKKQILGIALLFFLLLIILLIILGGRNISKMHLRWKGWCEARKRKKFETLLQRRKEVIEKIKEGRKAIGKIGDKENENKNNWDKKLSEVQEKLKLLK